MQKDMLNIDAADMLAAAPLLDLRARLAAELVEIIELVPNSDRRLDVARRLRDLDAALKEASFEAPTCDSETAAAIMGISERHATKLAKLGRVKGWHRVEGGRWTFDVKSCHAYAASNRKGKAAA